MCGIAGFYDENLRKQETENIIISMLKSIRHRGPDNSDFYISLPVCLGHNRLSIIDLSFSANQPLHYENLVLTYNGEIYNYIEIKKELIEKGYHFATKSDSEVILASYKEWGESCVQKFVGMWAFAIWDNQEKKMFCSRDRFGIKPFYYIHSGKRFYFGSEYKALKESPIFSNDINIRHLYLYVQLGWTINYDETFFLKLKELPAGHNLTLKDGNISIKKYYQIILKQNFTNISFEEKQESFKALFEQSIRQHMRSDVEVGACLSGGLDSSSIVSTAASLFPQKRINTFTIYYDGTDEVDERPWIHHIKRRYSNITSHFHKPNGKEIEMNFERYFHSMDTPPTGSSSFSQFFVMEMAAAENIKVLLDGQGADEYLCGYMHSFYRIFSNLLIKFKLYKALSEFTNHKRNQNFKFSQSLNILTKSLLSVFYNENGLSRLEYSKAFPFLPNDRNTNIIKNPPVYRSKDKLANHLYHLIFVSSLPFLLFNEDRNSMHFSIESRVPFLDHRLVDFVFTLNDSDKYYKGETKYILRNSLQNYVPNEILNRKDKKGFVTPGESKWLRGSLQHLLKSEYKNLNMFNLNKVHHIIKDYNNGNNKNAKIVWRLACLNKWLEENT